MQGKVSPAQDAQVRVYVGLDVCKAHLDVHLHPLGEQFRVANTALGLRQLKRRLVRLAVDRVVLEATGKLHRLAHRHLHAEGFAVAVVNPLRARLFAEAKGWLAKTDRLDARSLAILGEAMKPEARPPSAEEIEVLDELVRARQQAVGEQTALTNRMKASKGAFLLAEMRLRRAALREHIKRLQLEILRQIRQDQSLLRRYTILRSLRGVGPIAAATLLTAMSELGSCSAKAAALLAGLAPIARDSGQSFGQRHIRAGRAHVRAVLYMAALTAITHNPPLAAFYKGLLARGKAHKVAITAVMRKIIVLANTLLRDNRLWSTLSP
jgi:transposase